MASTICGTTPSPDQEEVTINNLTFTYTKAALLAILGEIVAVAITFGLHFTEANTRSVLTLAGLILGSISAGAGIKDGGLISANITLPSWLHFTPAALVSGLSAALALAAGYGLHMTQANIDSLLTLVGLVSAGMVVGGGVKSAAMLRAGTHPALSAHQRQRIQAKHEGAGVAR